MDGGPHSQPPIAPGARFEYRFTVDDAGTFWYHPHVNETGADGARALRRHRRARRERSLGSTPRACWCSTTCSSAPTGRSRRRGPLLEQHSGREGGVSVVNGRSGATLPIRAGQRQRWRIVNAGSARFYRLSLAGTASRWSAPTAARDHAAHQRRAPARAGRPLDVLVDGTGSPGATATLQNLPYERGHGAGLTQRRRRPASALHRRRCAPAARGAPRGAAHRAIADGGRHADATIAFNERIDRDTERVVFMINGRSYPDVPDIVTRVGATEVWDLVNESEMEHPFHLHGFFFQVVSRNGVPEASHLGGHDPAPRAGARAHRVPPGQPPRPLDVPLPHPRARRQRHDGAAATTWRSRTSASSRSTVSRTPTSAWPASCASSPDRRDSI
jgi:FtsP/CotA-like multicopper oxidase with cupredoxin domain